jgi:hypothetical protein
MDVTAHPTATTTNPANLRGHSTSDVIAAAWFLTNFAVVFAADTVAW